MTKPTQIKKLQGEKRAERIPAGEPKFKVIEPSPPAELDDIAKKEWKRTAHVLATVKVLTEADLAVLHGYCVSWSLYLQSYEVVKHEGRTLVEDRGSGENAYTILKKHPEFEAMRGALSDYLAFAQQLGMTPIARRKVAGVDSGEEGVAKLLSFDGGRVQVGGIDKKKSTSAKKAKRKKTSAKKTSAKKAKR